jgi:mannose-6-phosphate isomerase-like protein (cupin superfamily)
MMMTETQVIHGANFNGFHAGAKETWAEFQLERPVVPVRAKGKFFLRDLLNSKVLELSLNVLQPGKEFPFLHRHENNDEVYFVVSGQGQVFIDGEVIEMSEGSAVRVSPPGARVWRNNSTDPLYYICLQYPAESVIEGGTSDGRGVEGKAAWPN